MRYDTSKGKKQKIQACMSAMQINEFAKYHDTFNKKTMNQKLKLKNLLNSQIGPDTNNPVLRNMSTRRYINGVRNKRSVASR